jgi:hypothetical protein
VSVLNKVDEYRWYQSTLITYEGQRLVGIRLIAVAPLVAITNIWANMPARYFKFVHRVEVEEVPQNILEKYNLNDVEEYEAFLEMRRG